MKQPIDVLIVGAGPVGLFAAIELARYRPELNFRIIDKQEKISPFSRAFGLQPRTLETFLHSGIAEPFLTEGTYLKAMNINNDNKIVATIPFLGQQYSAPFSQFPSVLVLSQSKTEVFLNEFLVQRTGRKVERGVELIEYEQKEDRVIVKVKHKLRGDEEELIEAKYLLGCDGAHSSVRKLDRNWKFDGVVVEGNFILADFVADDKCGLPEMISSLFPGLNSIGILPLGQPRHYRLVGNVNESYRVINASSNTAVTHGISEHSNEYPKETPPLLEDIREYLDCSIPNHDIIIKELKWSTFFRVNQRIVENYRHGRVFLCGDAAHCHSPVGAQGLNIGIQDAQCLAYKLSLVLNEHTSNSEAVLNSYSAERHPIASAVLQDTGLATKLFFSSLTRYLLGYLFSLLSFQRYFRSKMLQYSHHYSNSPLLLQTTIKQGALIKAGQYMPDEYIKLDFTGNTTSLFEALKDTRHHLLLFTSNTEVSSKNGIDALLSITKRFKSSVRPVIVAYANMLSGNQLNYLNSLDITVLLETRGDLHRAVGVKDREQALVLVRPDLYVGAAVKFPMEISVLVRFLLSYLKEE
ncbi:uncharacterized protein VTP21DRAFT_1901 [Calcarisporiella thermophila]|uniref:uncharacterized protein n=1 Tax=Calcarisporiella thermophila TaxID=911321 RepID=UPI0037423129